MKRGPKIIFNFSAYPVRHEIELAPLKQSSFKSMLSKFNKIENCKHVYKYEQISTTIIATRTK
jgi:hypothetical protein